MLEDNNEFTYSYSSHLVTSAKTSTKSIDVTAAEAVDSVVRVVVEADAAPPAVVAATATGTNSFDLAIFVPVFFLLFLNKDKNGF